MRARMQAGSPAPAAPPSALLLLARQVQIRILPQGQILRLRLRLPMRRPIAARPMYYIDDGTSSDVGSVASGFSNFESSFGMNNVVVGSNGSSVGSSGLVVV